METLLRDDVNVLQTGLVVVGPVQPLKVVMSDGNGDSGGGGGVRGDDGARGAGPREPQSQGSQVGQRPALSPGLAVQRAPGAAAGGGWEGTAGFWMGTWPRELWPSGVCCGCIARGAGGGWRTAPGAASGTHLDPRGLLRCHCVGWFAEGSDIHDI